MSSETLHQRIVETRHALVVALSKTVLLILHHGEEDPETGKSLSVRAANLRNKIVTLNNILKGEEPEFDIIEQTLWAIGDQYITSKAKKSTR